MSYKESFMIQRMQISRSAVNQIGPLTSVENKCRITDLSLCIPIQVGKTQRDEEDLDVSYVKEITAKKLFYRKLKFSGNNILIASLVMN